MQYLDKEYLVITDTDEQRQQLNTFLSQHHFFPSVVILDAELEAAKIDILLEWTTSDSFTYPCMFGLEDDCCPEPKLITTGFENICKTLTGATA